jgi:two-component system NtrC family sensor kinase
VSTTPDSALADPQQIIADLQRELAERTAERDEASRRLDERTAERDEALQREIAAAEVLQVINSSPGDLAPVFEAMLEKARVLCGFAHGDFNIYDGEYFRTVAFYAMPEAFAELLRQPRRPSGAAERLLQGEEVVHIADMTAMEFSISPDEAIRRAAVEAGLRTVLFVPLRKDGALLGYITANRREVRPSPTNKSHCCRTSRRRRS